MPASPADRRYSKEHEWVKADAVRLYKVRWRE